MISRGLPLLCTYSFLCTPLWQRPSTILCSHPTATSARHCPWEHACWGTVRCFLCFLHVNSLIFSRRFSFVLLFHRVLLYWLYLAPRFYFSRSASSYETCHTASTAILQHTRVNSNQLWTNSNAHFMCFFHKKSPVFYLGPAIPISFQILCESVFLDCFTTTQKSAITVLFWLCISLYVWHFSHSASEPRYAKRLHVIYVPLHVAVCTETAVIYVYQCKVSDAINGTKLWALILSTCALQ